MLKLLGLVGGVWLGAVKDWCWVLVVLEEMVVGIKGLWDFMGRIERFRSWETVWR